MTEVRYNLRSHARAASLPESTPRKYTPGDFPLSPVETVARQGHCQDTTSAVIAPWLLYSEVTKARSLQAQDVLGEKSNKDSSTLVSVYTINAQENSPEVKNEPSGVPISPLSEVPDGTENSDDRTTDSDDNGQWTQVRRRECRKKPNLAAPTGAESKLSPGQIKIVQEAEQRLTTPQRETIKKRARAVGVPHSFRFGRPRNDDDVSRGEGPSQGKGKGPDPGNWGDIDFSDEDIDLDAQRAALESWKTVQKWARSQSDVPWIEELPDSDTGTKHGCATSRVPVPTGPPIAPKTVERVGSCQGDVESSSGETEVSRILTSKKHKKKTTHRKKDRTWKVKMTEKARELPARSTDPVRALVDKTVAQPGTRRERRATPRAMEPVEQINPKSYIGLALTRLNKGKRTDKDKGSPSDSSGSSSTSLSSLTGSDNSSDSLTSNSDESGDSSDSSSSSSSSRAVGGESLEGVKMGVRPRRPGLA